MLLSWLEKAFNGRQMITRKEAHSNLRHLPNNLIEDLLKEWEGDGLIKRKRKGGIIEISSFDTFKYFLK